jgi:hypothetical protein
MIYGNRDGDGENRNGEEMDKIEIGNRNVIIA